MRPQRHISLHTYSCPDSFIWTYIYLTLHKCLVISFIHLHDFSNIHIAHHRYIHLHECPCFPSSSYALECSFFGLKGPDILVTILIHMPPHSSSVFIPINKQCRLLCHLMAPFPPSFLQYLYSSWFCYSSQQ